VAEVLKNSKNPQEAPQEEPWTLGRLLTWTTEYLTSQGAESPRLDAEILLAESRGCPRIDLYAAFDEIAPDETRDTFRELVSRRAKGTPVAYLVGRREFFALDFEVTPEVLIPRPETELLVVALLDQIKANQADEATASKKWSIADVGTGSGILAICAAKHVSLAQVTAIDISPTALAVAKRNAERHEVSEKITFLESDLFDRVDKGVRFDYVLSNPPYVSTAEMAQLPTDVKNFEPHQALHAGEQGTEVIERLVPQAAERLQPGGALFLEVSPMIADAVEKIVQNQPGLELGTTIRDLAGHARVVVAQK